MIAALVEARAAVERFAKARLRALREGDTGASASFVHEAYGRWVGRHGGARLALSRRAFDATLAKLGYVRRCQKGRRGWTWDAVVRG